MKPMTRLLFLLQGEEDVAKRKFWIRNFLEYHFTSGEMLNSHRAVEECNDKHCKEKGCHCVSFVQFMNYKWCIPV